MPQPSPAWWAWHFLCEPQSYYPSPASWWDDKSSPAPCKRGSAESPLAAVGGLSMGRMLNRAFALIIPVGISFCKEVCMFIKDEIAWGKTRIWLSKHLQHKRHWNRHYDKNGAGYRLVICRENRTVFQFAQQKQCNIMLKNESEKHFHCLEHRNTVLI